MIALALAGALMAAPVDISSPPPAIHQDLPDHELPTRLGDVEVRGSSLDTMIRRFVAEVGAPNEGRNLARWRDRICIATENIQPQGAKYLTDRVSAVAGEFNVRAESANCRPNVLIIASADATAVAASLVETKPRAFNLGSGKTNQGARALRAFQQSTQPVRWWHVSVPTDRSLGTRAIRLPGDPCDVMPCSPDVSQAVSRLRTDVVDNLERVIIVINSDHLSRVSSRQIADYVAFLALAQIDPEVDTSRYASILNLFNDPESVDGLTDWDHAYLEGLYRAQMVHKGSRSGNAEVAASIHRAHSRLEERMLAYD